MTRRHRCPAGQEVVLVRNIAARGRRRTFTLALAPSVAGRVRVRRGPLPFFIGATASDAPLTHGMRVERRFFDASFELSVLAEQSVEVSVT